MRAGLLGVPPHANVLHVRRLRMADDQPMALEDLHVPLDVAPDLTGEDLEDTSFYDLLATRYGTPITSGTQTVEPCLTSAEEAELLGVDPGAPAFLFERTSRMADGRIAEFVRSIYRGDRYRLVTELHARDHKLIGGPVLVPREGSPQ
jgi:GntR family transcriptional regulator